MSAAYPTHAGKGLNSAKPSAWCCARAFLIVGAGAASWVAAIVILMRI